MIVRSTLIANRRFLPLSFTALFLVVASLVSAQTIRYVKQGGTGAGVSWADAAGDLQATINASAVGDEIWVAAGTYLPTRPANNVDVVALNNRNNAFTFTKDLTIYGGFPAVGNPEIGDRDWEMYPTVLSGNIGDPNDETDNAYHVVITAGTSVSKDFLIDGFTITGGYGDGTATITVNGQPSHPKEGAGWSNVAAAPTANNLLITGNTVVGSGNGAGWYNNLVAEPILTNSIIRDNHASMGQGGGMHNGNGSTVTLNNVIFSGNTASTGGAMSTDSEASTVVTNATFSGNSAQRGGALSYITAAAALTNVLISGNSSTVYGGGIFNEESQLTITNTTMTGNSAPSGGAVYVPFSADPPSITGRNNIIWGNSSGIYSLFLIPELRYSFLQDEAGDPTNIVGADPIFVDPRDYTDAPFVGGDYRLQALSPAVDAGNSALYPGDLLLDTDVAGNPRLIGASIDMGAYELPEAVITPGVGNILHVNSDVAGGNGTGEDWTNAIAELADALAWAKANAANWTGTTPLQIWVAAGEYRPATGESFEMVEQVQIYGGFAGTENLLDMRNWQANRTTLHGNGGSVIRNPSELNLSRSARLDGFTVTGGESGEGGGIYNWTGATFANLVVIGNTATGSGGGIRNFASGFYYNLLITGNTSPLGAGFFTTVEGSNPMLVNVTSSGNSGDMGPEFYLEAGTPTIVNSILFGSGVHSAIGIALLDVRYSLVQNHRNTANGNVLGTIYPLFTDPANGDFSLSPASAAINAGSNEAYEELVGGLVGANDLVGASRLQQGRIDMGAFESLHNRVLVPEASKNILYVNQTVDQSSAGYKGDGSSWSQALPDLANALIWVKANAANWTAGNSLEIWVAEGQYQPSAGQSFELLDFVAIYGGFNGRETELGERRPNESPSNLMGQDASVVHNPEGLTLSRQARLDGFVIHGGAAAKGGAILNYGDATFANLNINSNTATLAGGGVYNAGSPLFHDVIIAANDAPAGAEFFNTPTGAPVLVNVTAMGLPNLNEVFSLNAGNPVIINSVLLSSSAVAITDETDVQHSLISGRTSTENGNIADDDWVRTITQGFNEALFFLPVSPLINAGSNARYEDLVGAPEDRFDALGAPRLQRGVIDIGAMESSYWKAVTPDGDNIVYVDKLVDQDVVGYRGDGSSWEHAVPELADALLWARFVAFVDQEASMFGADNPLKIYVARGTYLPLYAAADNEFIYDGGRDNAFVMVPNVQLFGGFDPARDIDGLADVRLLPTALGAELDGTILSGNIGDPLLSTDNAYHVLIAAGTGVDEHALVDGIAITGGYADGSDGASVTVGGLDINPDRGAGWYNAESAPRINNVLIHTNLAHPVGTVAGAGVFNTNGRPVISNSIFRNNAAESGNGGGMGNSIGAHPTMTNVLFHGNTALSGAGSGIHNEQSSVTLNNVTITSNADGTGEGVISNIESILTISNSIIFRNSSGIGGEPEQSINNSLVQGLSGGSNGNIDGSLDPRFTDADNGDFSLRTNSPTINQGRNEDYPGDLTTARDLGGNPRLLGVVIDMGAYESGVAAITALADIPAIPVPLGTTRSEISVPDPFTVEATLNDGSTAQVVLDHDLTHWALTFPSSGIYDGNVAGRYRFEIEVGSDPSGAFGNPLGLRATVEVIVQKGVPVVVWEKPTALTYGDPLTIEQLDASADVAGTLSYNPEVGALLPAGEHTLAVTFVPDDEANFESATAEVLLTVAKAPAVITAEAVQTYGYDGTLQHVVASLNHTETALAYSPQQGYTNAGTYSITVNADETTNYLAASKDVTLVIEKADWTGMPVTFPTVGSIVYDGEQHEFVADHIPPGGEVSYTIIDSEGNESPGNAITDAGDYTVVVVVRQDNYADITVSNPVTIEKAPAVITAEAVQTYGYDGTLQHVVASLNHTETALAYSPQQGYTNAGTYSITVNADETTNYLAASKDVTLVIEKADWTGMPVTFPTVGSIVYDGEQHEFVADHIPPGGEVSYTIIDSEGNESPGNAITDAGDYTVVVVVRQDNYADITVSNPVTIEKAPAVITAEAVQTYGYDGTLQHVVASLNHTETALTYSPQQGYTDSGVYPITVTAVETANYLRAEALTVTLRIENAVWDGPRITLPQAQTFEYDGGPHPITVVYLPPGAAIVYTVTDRNGNTIPGNEVIEVGEYTVSASVKQHNYQDIVVTTVVTVKPTARVFKFPELPAKAYGDADFSPGAVASSGEAVHYTSSNPAVAEITAEGLIRIMGVGEVTITATVLENGNYTGPTQVSQTLVVGKALQSIIFNAPEEVTRDAGTVQLDVTATSGLPVSLTVDDEQLATVSGSTLNILRLGTVRITAKQAGDANHEAAEPVTVTVRVVDPASDFPIRVHPVLSPNGDGINEFLMIEGIRDYSENRVTVFNRNGTLLWEASGYDSNRVVFRGISTAQLQLPAGTYFYILEVKVNGKWEHRKGYFVLRY
ncbi:choice-of-anchor Q domain-containing protein [Parapedobacter pyrenivorans]|uniref:choice-of-anchor Q domain-containing protein n=1 Tax=Parapedobacter pyrenivorans TaxID=1305674 RepID=UPI003342355E